MRAWVDLLRRWRDDMQKVRGALGRMRHRELSTSLLQWLTYVDGQACTTAYALHGHGHVHARCMHTALLLSMGRPAAVR